MSRRPSDRVDGARLWDRHLALARIGGTPDGGVDRPALSALEIEARAQLVAWGRAIGLKPYTDGIANLFLCLEGSDPEAAPVLAGSHIDSQPTGGRFDGVFGVLAALEALEAMVAEGFRPRRPVEVVAWTNEEGSRFAPGMTGSEVFTGVRTLEEVRPVRDAAGVSVGEAVDAVLAADADVPRRGFARPVAAFVEPHIEQGPVLERHGIPIGVVSGIQGTRRYRVRVTGEAAHAGTALRAERRDALMAAVRMIHAADRAASAVDVVKLTVGMLELTPNAPSVVPSEAYFSVDLRHPEDTVVDRLDVSIREIVESERGPCEATLQQIAHAPSLTFSKAIQDLIGESCDRLSIPFRSVYSAAGHDARQLHYVCPTGMIFVPCRGGISHNPKEWSEPQHLFDGARVLADVLWQLGRVDV